MHLSVSLFLNVSFFHSITCFVLFSWGGFMFCFVREGKYFVSKIVVTKVQIESYPKVMPTQLLY